MRRYTTKAWYTVTEGDWLDVPQGTPTVFEREPGTVPTGVLDKDGNMIFAYECMDPIGFVHFEGEDD